MKQPQDDLREIRKMMDRSSRFLSLSGSSGVFIGLFALVYSAYASYTWEISYLAQEDFEMNRSWSLFILGCFGLLLVCLVLSMALTLRRTLKKGLKVWDKSTRNILLSIGLPMMVGATLLLNELMHDSMRGFFGITLLCYGLGLFSASRYTYNELRIMGMFSLALGALAILDPAKGLLYWSLGFGVLHVIYGTLMYFRYEK